MTTESLDFIIPLIMLTIIYGLSGFLYASFTHRYNVADTGRDLYKGELLFVGMFWIFIVFVMLVITLVNMCKNLIKIIKNILAVFASKIK